MQSQELTNKTRSKTLNKCNLYSHKWWITECRSNIQCSRNSKCKCHRCSQAWFHRCQWWCQECQHLKSVIRSLSSKNRLLCWLRCNSKCHKCITTRPLHIISRCPKCLNGVTNHKWLKCQWCLKTTKLKRSLNKQVLNRAKERILHQEIKRGHQQNQINLPQKKKLCQLL